jgi:hypothetical protein
MTSAANEYVVRAPARAPVRGGALEGFGSLTADLQEEILQHVRVEVSLREQLFRSRPDDMAADLAQYPFLWDAAYPLLFAVTQEYVVSRARRPACSRRSYENSVAWGRLLTIKLRESVDRTRLIRRFRRLTQPGCVPEWTAQRRGLECRGLGCVKSGGSTKTGWKWGIRFACSSSSGGT